MPRRCAAAKRPWPAMMRFSESIRMGLLNPSLRIVAATWAICRGESVRAVWGGFLWCVRPWYIVLVRFVWAFIDGLRVGFGDTIVGFAPDKIGGVISASFLPLNYFETTFGCYPYFEFCECENDCDQTG